MVFSSVPLYLDPPNWQQHPNQQILQGNSAQGGNHDQNQHLIPPPPLSQPNGQSPVGMGGGGGGGPGGQAIRPNSMAERARLAKIPPPEAPQKCPRCDSTNTKFCYFNNYSLSQPRHFCKTCRRYWTRGGALRNVPVGGGCRRNKRSSSKSSSGGGSGGGSSSSKSSLTSPTTLVGGDRIPLHMDLVSSSGLGHTIPGIPSGGGGTLGMSSFMASLQNITQLGMGNLGLSFGGALGAPPHHLGALGGLTSGTHGGVLGGGGSGGDYHLDFPHLNPTSTNPQVQFPNFLGGFEIPGSSNNGANGAGLYTSSYQNDHQIQNMGGGDHNEDHEQGNISLQKTSSSDMSSQFAPIKTEDNGQGLEVHKQFMNNATGNQFWGGNNIGNNTTGTTSMWTDLSGLNSSSTSHLL